MLKFNYLYQCNQYYLNKFLVYLSIEYQEFASLLKLYQILYRKAFVIETSAIVG
jgi:hypothetical protein